MIDPLQILVTLLLGTAVFLLVWSLFRFPVSDEPPLHRRIATALNRGQRNTVFEQAVVAAPMNLALSWARRMHTPALRRHIRRNLDAAGNPNGYSVEEYLAICLACSAMLAAVTVALMLLMGTFSILAFAAMGVIGFAIPLLALRGAARARLRRISRQLPYSLDLVALMMGAGSTFNEAVQTIIRDDPRDDFNQELQIVLSEVEFGSKRAVALQNMAERLPMDAMRSIVGAVNQAELLGTPLSTILKNQSNMLRLHRSVQAEKVSASASLRILYPTMLILIAVVLFVFGPLIIRLARGELL